MSDDSTVPSTPPPGVPSVPSPKPVVPSNDQFHFAEHNEHHNHAYGAIEYISGCPLLILNLPEYADSNFEVLHAKAAANAVTSTTSDVSWAQDYVARHPGRDPQDLATAMTVASSESWLGTFPRELSFFNHQTFWSTIALLLLTATMLIFARRRIDQLKPASRTQHIFEVLVLFIRDDVVRPNIAHGDRWVPFFTSLFLVILACNLFGIIPFFATATGNIGVTGAFALFIFILMMYQGMKQNGPVGFFFNIIPVKWSWKPFDMAIFILLMAIEWLSLLTRPIILAIRLFANMLAGHTVLLVFLSLGFIINENAGSLVMAHGLGAAGWLISIPFYALELLVAVIQAYIFTLLSAIFIGQCAHPEH